VTDRSGQSPARRGANPNARVRRADELAAWHARCPAEVPVDRDQVIVDAHHHLWDSPERGRYLLADLLDDMRGGHNVAATIFIECRSMYRDSGPREMAPVGEVEFVDRIAAMSASGGYGCFVGDAIVGKADLLLGSAVRPVLEAEMQAGRGRFRGVRYSSTWDASKGVTSSAPPHTLADPRFREAFAELADLGLSFDALLYHPQLGDLIDLSRAFPEVAIIVDHVGAPLSIGPYRSDQHGVMETWRASLTELARSPQVYMKIGGMGTGLQYPDFRDRSTPPSSDELAVAWRPYVESCIEIFGSHRCMFESNFPADKQTCGYTQLWNAFQKLTTDASETERADLYAGTATRAYQLSRQFSGS
jgi:L-fuconolactonase